MNISTIITNYTQIKDSHRERVIHSHKLTTVWMDACYDSYNDLFNPECINDNKFLLFVYDYGDMVLEMDGNTYNTDNEYYTFLQYKLLVNNV